MCSVDGNDISSAGASELLEAVAAHCPAVERVDLSSCGITHLAIPVTFCHNSLASVKLDDNPMVSPPPEVVARGWDAVRAFAIEVHNASVPCNRVKLLLVGDGSAGKSSIVAVVKAVVPALTRARIGASDGVGITVDLPVGGDSGRTIGVEQLTLPMQSSTSGRELVATVVDVAGQHESYPTHVFFMSHRSVVSLVVDLSWHVDDEVLRLEQAIRFVVLHAVLWALCVHSLVTLCVRHCSIEAA
jgi:internalin A